LCYQNIVGKSLTFRMYNFNQNFKHIRIQMCLKCSCSVGIEMFSRFSICELSMEGNGLYDFVN
jgi:hypothetical protein